MWLISDSSFICETVNLTSSLLFPHEPGLLAQKHLIEHEMNGVTYMSIQIIHMHSKFYACFSG